MNNVIVLNGLEWELTVNPSYTHKQFLAFKSGEKAKIFLELYKDLINVFFQNK